jgi:hypothetical protein
MPKTKTPKRPAPTEPLIREMRQVTKALKHATGNARQATRDIRQAALIQYRALNLLDALGFDTCAEMVIVRRKLIKLRELRIAARKR